MAVSLSLKLLFYYFQLCCLYKIIHLCVHSVFDTKVYAADKATIEGGKDLRLF